MKPIVWIPVFQVQGILIKQMAYGGMIEYVEPGQVYKKTEIFDIDDYVILVDVDELESE